MSYDNIYKISQSGMDLEKTRIELVANNIANQNTIIKPGEVGFTPMQVDATVKPFVEFLDDVNSNIVDINIVPENLSPNKVYQPGNPLADQKGYITYPGISTIDEMTTLMKASRAYEANIKIINVAHSMYLQALTIGDEH